MTDNRSSVYLRVFRRWWWLPILLALMSGGITYAGTRALLKPLYGASATLEVVPYSSEPATSQPQNATTIASVITSRTVEQRAINALHGYGRLDPGAISRTVCVADSTDLFVNCSTSSRNYLAAISAMNTLVSTWEVYNRAQSHAVFQTQLNGYNRQINQLQSQINSLKAYQARTGVNVQYEIGTLEPSLNGFKASRLAVEGQITALEGSVRETSAPTNQRIQVSPHPLRNALLGVIVGIGIAAALIVFLEYLDDSFRSSDEIAESTGLSLLGSVRKYTGTTDEMGMVAAKMPRTAIAEAYRVVRANIQFTNVSGSLKVLVVTSARDGEGKTTTANNLATTFALAGQRVLLVDCDLRRPGLTKMLRLKETQGLSSALTDPAAQVTHSTDVVGLSVVPSGPIPPNPAELLGSGRMRAWVEKAAQAYDLVVMDTPPVLSVADTRIVATLADGVVLVLDPSLTTRRMVKQARAAIENVGARILGVMLNRDVMRGEGYYYNYYYYDRSAGREEPRAVEGRR